MTKSESTNTNETKKSKKKNKAIISFDDEIIKKEQAVEVMKRNTSNRIKSEPDSITEKSLNDDENVSNTPVKARKQKKKSKISKSGNDADNVFHQNKKEITQYEEGVVSGNENQSISLVTKSKSKKKSKKRNPEGETNTTADGDAEVQPKKIKLSDEGEENEGDNLKSIEANLKKDSKRAQKKLKHEKLVAEKKSKAEVATQESTLNYLSKWKHCRQEWKFEKLKQIWLSQHMFDCSKIPSEFWETLVEYFTSSRGFIRKLVLRDALKIIEDEEKLEDENVSEDREIKVQRARYIVQSLQE